MSLYDIIIAPDPVLKEQAQPIETVTPDVQKQMERMLETMYHAPGIGLAANQVGLLNRVLVMDCDPAGWEYAGEDDGVLRISSAYRSGKDQEIEQKKNAIVMANPEIIWRDERHSMFEEGCLSLPGQYGEVERPARVRVKYLDFEGKPQEQEFEGLPAHCVQHEIDHLDGVLFVDYLSNLKRNMILRRMDKLKKQQVL